MCDWMAKFDFLSVHYLVQAFRSDIGSFNIFVLFYEYFYSFLQLNYGCDANIKPLLSFEKETLSKKSKEVFFLILYSVPVSDFCLKYFSPSVIILLVLLSLRAYLY